MTKQLSQSVIKAFQAEVLSFYRDNKREFPFRNVDNPYWVTVSEYMLQQTQTARVVPFFNAFIDAFPTVKSVAVAPLGDVLALWQGLGYNRRAKFLKRTAEAVVDRFDGVFPGDVDVLQTLPGIGPYTASAIAAFAFNQPVVLIETNIRALFIHSFFSDALAVSDSEIVSLIRQTLLKENPREWYYALMDYGVEIKKRYPNPSRKSKHYTKQSRFEGSRRQKRGALIRALTQTGTLSTEEACSLLQCKQEEAQSVIKSLESEGLIVEENGRIYLPR